MGRFHLRPTVLRAQAGSTVSSVPLALCGFSAPALTTQPREPRQ